MDTVLATFSVSVTELKRNYATIMKSAAQSPVVVLNHNRPEAYLVPAARYEAMMALLEDVEDARLVKERAGGPFVEVSLDAL